MEFLITLKGDPSPCPGGKNPIKGRKINADRIFSAFDTAAVGCYSRRGSVDAQPALSDPAAGLSKPALQRANYTCWSKPAVRVSQALCSLSKRA